MNKQILCQGTAINESQVFTRGIEFLNEQVGANERATFSFLLNENLNLTKGS